MQAKSLLIDAGNTRCKSRVLLTSALEQIAWQELCISDDIFSVIHTHADASAIYMASVRDVGFNQAVKQYCDERNITLNLISTEMQRFGLKNSYSNVSKMGVDRWLAMLGAQLFADEHYLVIDAGTAITCDAVSSFQHIGGWIAPGYRLLRQAVTANTARVSEADLADMSLQWGQDTEACLHFGCIAQLHGLIQQAADLMHGRNVKFQTVISGGDVDKLIEARINGLEKQPLFIENIVLFGLLRYALSELSLTQQKNIASSLITQEKK